MGTRAPHGTWGARGRRKGARARQRHVWTLGASPEAPRASVLALPLGVPITPQCWYPERCPQAPHAPRGPQSWSGRIRVYVPVHTTAAASVWSVRLAVCVLSVCSPRGSGTWDTLALGMLVDK